MPWKEAGPVLERMRFIEDYLSGFYTLTELAARFGVSRRIAHKWLSRHDADGANGLHDRSRAPIRIPHRTDDKIAAQVIAFRQRFPQRVLPMFPVRAVPYVPGLYRQCS